MLARYHDAQYRPKTKTRRSNPFAVSLRSELVLNMLRAPVCEICGSGSLRFLDSSLEYGREFDTSVRLQGPEVRDFGPGISSGPRRGLGVSGLRFIQCLGLPGKT